MNVSFALCDSPRLASRRDPVFPTALVRGLSVVVRDLDAHRFWPRIARGLLSLPHRSRERAKRPAKGGRVDTSETLPKLSGDGRGIPHILAAEKNLVV